MFENQQDAMLSDESLKITPRSRFRAAMALAMLADALQVLIFPVFVEGVFSPADDVLDVVLAAVLTYLLGWHWEFLPSLAGELIPGVDLVPLWTLAVANVYRKWRSGQPNQGREREHAPVLRPPEVMQ